MRPYAFLVGCVIALAVMVSQHSHGQPPTPDPQDAAIVTENGDAETTQGSKSVGGMIVSGGRLNILFFGILGVFSLWAATVVFERIVNLRREKLLPQSFETQLSLIVQDPQQDADQFRSLCESTRAPVSRIFQAGVARAGRPLPEVEKAMEDAAAREMAALRGKSRPLNVVGSIAPLVGLLGTVVGMIMAFQISSQEGLGKAERLAEGIYLALMTTAAGLTIAIPCLLFAAWFLARAERYMCDIAECLSKAVPSFAKLEGQPLPAANAKKTAPVDRVAQAVPTTAADHELTVREKFLREGVVE